MNLGDYKGRIKGAEGCVFESGGGEGVVLLLVSSRGLVCCFFAIGLTGFVWIKSFNVRFGTRWTGTEPQAV